MIIKDIKFVTGSVALGVMMQNKKNGGYPNWPVPISVIELFEESLKMLVKEGKAKLWHDGSVEYNLFKSAEPFKSLKYTKLYRVDVGDDKIAIKLVFDKREGKNIGWIRVSGTEFQLLKDSNILPVPIVNKEN